MENGMTHKTAFDAPAHDRWFEDYRDGDQYLFGPLDVTEAEVIAFARRYDPQAIHVDAEAAGAGPYGGLIASGWMTAALMMRLMVDHYLSTCAALASPGCDELRWLHPVRPGDSLHLQTTVLSARVSASKPDRGVVRTRMEGINQHGATVYSCIGTVMMLRRPT